MFDILVINILLSEHEEIVSSRISMRIVNCLVKKLTKCFLFLKKFNEVHSS